MDFLMRLVLAVSVFSAFTVPLQAQQKQPLESKEVLDSIELAKRYIVSQQNGDGSWSPSSGDNFQVGITSLSMLSLLNAGMTNDDVPIKKGLKYLRGLKDSEPHLVYEVALTIMAFAAAKDGTNDRGRMLKLAARLERSQMRTGNNAGSWSYSTAKGTPLNLGGDNSNGQFALLGLREAAHAGVTVGRATWERAKKHWEGTQNSDGSWGYSGAAGGHGTGSMTAAGISSLVICYSMLKEGRDRNRNGEPDCCTPPEEQKHLERAINWMGKKFQRGNNPGSAIWLLYYQYGLERAGRLSGRRFFGDHDWYREIAEYIIRNGQNKRQGWVKGVGGLETDPHIGTCFALLFLSKGLAPVLINKLDYGEEQNFNGGIAGAVKGFDRNWLQQQDDARNLTEHISGLKKWPKLLTWQVVQLKKVIAHGGVEDLLQSKVLYITGSKKPEFTPDEIKVMKEYISQGGFILAVSNCSTEFERGFREVVKEMYREENLELLPLASSHPLYRSEYLLDAESLPLEGADFGCRTAIVLAPTKLNLAFLWDRWAVAHPPERDNEMKLMIQKGMQVGTNIIAYATGREPPKKLDPETKIAGNSEKDPIERGLLQVAKLRHGGGWDTAPKALRNLLGALNQAVGTTASLQQKNLAATDSNLFQYPLLYMHGRESFSMSTQEREKLKQYLDQGGLIFADACCGSRNFNKSFREMANSLYPKQKLERIKVSQQQNQSHEIFTSKVGYDIRQVERRAPESNNPDAALNSSVKSVEPLLEGIEVDGRLVVIYSPYDLSCALQRQASVACAGYTPDAATKIAINVVLYSLMQDISYLEQLEATP